MGMLISFFRAGKRLPIILILAVYNYNVKKRHNITVFHSLFTHN